MLLFAWLNGMTHKTMRPYPQLLKLMYNVGGFHVKDSSGYPVLDSKAGFPLWIDARKIDNCWISSRFRYCPLCLEGAYHSALFQIIPITCCPIHHVPLSDRCHCCQVFTPGMADEKKMYGKPYHCVHCGGPLGGVEPCLEMHIEFRDAISQVVSALQPYSNWWSAIRTAHRRIKVECIEASPTMYQSWWSAIEFTRATVYKKTPQLEYLLPSRYANDRVVTLNWVCRYNDSVPAYRANSSLADHGCTMYRYILAKLRRWITQKESLSIEKFNDLVSQHTFAKNSACSVRLQAFVALRCHLEAHFVQTGAHNLGAMENAVLCGKLFQNIAHYGSRTARLEWLAIFFALYAFWHARLSDGPKSGLENIWTEVVFYEQNLCHDSRFFESSPAERNCLLSRRHFMYEKRRAWFEGEVSFLKVDDMPLWPWDRKSKREHATQHFSAERQFPSNYPNDVI